MSGDKNGLFDHLTLTDFFKTAAIDVALMFGICVAFPGVYDAIHHGVKGLATAFTGATGIGGATSVASVPTGAADFLSNSVASVKGFLGMGGAVPTPSPLPV